MRHKLIKPTDELSRWVRPGRYVKALLGAILLVIGAVLSWVAYEDIWQQVSVPQDAAKSKAAKKRAAPKTRTPRKR